MFAVYKLTPLGEVDVLLVLLLGDGVRLLVGQTSSDSSGLLVSEVKGEVCVAVEKGLSRITTNREGRHMSRMG